MGGLVLETFRIMVLGMGTVFFVLALFVLIVIGLQNIFPYKPEEEENSSKH